MSFEFLDFFLMNNAESLLFVDYEKPEIAKRHIFLQEPVSSHNQVQFPFLEPFQDHLLFSGIAETGNHFNIDRISVEPPCECVEMR